MQEDKMNEDSEIDAIRNAIPGPYILYFRSVDTEIDAASVKQLELDTKCSVSIVDSWPRLIIELNICSKLEIGNNYPIVLVDAEMFDNKDVTASEIVNMMSTMHFCFAKPMKMRLAVVVNQKCNSKTIKILQETDIMGIIPCAKTFGYDRTIAALHSIIDNKPYWPKDLIDIIVGKITITIPQKTGINLTNRQSQVLSLVCNRGLSNKKIAQVLNISESTVKVHISAILKEYGVRNRTQLALAGSSSLKV
jgi:DNA-binding NarL/FixJ family response regulator